MNKDIPKIIWVWEKDRNGMPVRNLHCCDEDEVRLVYGNDIPDNLTPYVPLTPEIKCAKEMRDALKLLIENHYTMSGDELKRRYTVADNLLASIEKAEEEATNAKT